MSAQELLTFLFDAIALSFIAIAVFDLGREIVILYKQVFLTPTQPTLLASQPKPLPQLPDPWLLPTAEASVPPERATQEQPKPVLLLAPARAADGVELSANRATSKEVLRDINVDTLKLRDARKLAKVLGISQKVNGRDQTLAFLQSQIKAKLQQETSRLPEVMSVVRKQLIAC